MAAAGGSSPGASSSARKKAKGKTAASLALFPTADETFAGLLPRYPVAAAQLRDPAPLRKGKWSKEEDELATTCIRHFHDGLIALSGTGDDTLRGLLSYMLHSDGMRVTKKFAGELSIRKQQYVALAKQARASRGTQQAVDAHKERAALAERFLSSLEIRGGGASRRRAPASSPAKVRAVAKRRRPEQPARPAKTPRASTDDGRMATDLADASAAAMARVHTFLPASSMSPGHYVAYQQMPHPSQHQYPFTVAVSYAGMAAPGLVPLSSMADDPGRSMPGAIVPLVPSHPRDLHGAGNAAATATFGHTPPPGAMYAMSLPTVFGGPADMAMATAHGHATPVPAHSAYAPYAASLPQAAAGASAPVRGFVASHSPMPTASEHGMVRVSPPMAMTAHPPPSGMDALGAYAEEVLRGGGRPRTSSAAAAAAEAAAEAAADALAPRALAVPRGEAEPAAASHGRARHAVMGVDAHDIPAAWQAREA